MWKMPEKIQEMKKEVSYGELMKVDYDSSLTGAQRYALVLLPPRYDCRKTYPVLYLLHGIGGDEEEWLHAKPKEMLGNLMAAREIPEMITVFPNERVRADDRKNPSDVFTLEHYKAFDKFLYDLEENLMPFINQRFPIKKGRENTAIGGLSMGGRESLYIGFSRPELFGYIAAFSPAYGIFPYENNGVTEEGLIPEKEFKLPEEYKTFVMIMNGKNDKVVHNEALRYHRALVQNRVRHLYYTIPGGHDFSVWSNGLYCFVKHLFNEV